MKFPSLMRQLEILGALLFALLLLPTPEAAHAPVIFVPGKSWCSYKQLLKPAKQDCADTH